jgi:hypothetical protein
MFETPSAQIVEDSRPRILKNGYSEKQFDEIQEISEVFDKLRHLKNQNQDRHLHFNKDRELADYFEQVFEKSIQTNGT